MDDVRRPAQPPRRLDTVFLTGPGGLVYEFPREVAEQHLVTAERLHELGHLPITPYGARDDDAPATRGSGDEVSGRHLAVPPTDTVGYHAEARLGVFRGPDGYYYHGEHVHPHGDATGQPA